MTRPLLTTLAGCFYGLFPMLASSPVKAEALALVVGEPVTRVVPAGPGVAVLRRSGAWLLDGDGRAGARCLGGDQPADSPRRADRTALASDEVLREAGFSDDDESSEAEAMVDDEGAAPRAAHRRGPASEARALDLAGADGAVWIGADDGVWRLDLATGRCARVGLPGHAVQHVAAAGAAVVAVSGATVWRGGGDSFEVAAVLPSPARAATVTGDGTILVADDDGVVEIGPARTLRRVLEGRVEALITCGPVVYALTSDGAYRLNGADVDRLGSPPPARALACAWPRLLAAGLGLWASPDGASWTEEPVGLGRAFAGVAFAAGRPWLAGTDGLFVPVPERDEALVAGDGPRPHLRRRAASPPLWAALRPHLAVVFDDWTESQGRAGWRLWMALTLTLDRRVLARAAATIEVAP
jgi:hypothetical protein